MITDKCEEVRITLEEQEIRVWIYGERKNPVVLFIHGLGKSFSEYIGDLPVRYLMNDYCVIAFDLPGWGTSKEMNISVDQCINAIITQLNIETFYIFGTSYGGVVGSLYSIKNSNKVKGLIVAGTPRLSMVSFVFLLISYRIPYQQLFKAFKDFVRFGRKLSKITVPTLLLYSSDDRIAPKAQGEFFLRNIEKSELIVISGRSHGWLLHRIIDNDFCTAIEKFLKIYS